MAGDSEAGVRYGEAAGRWVLAATVLGSSVAFLDATVVNIALPTIGRDLGAGASGLTWTVNAYTLTLAAFVLVAMVWVKTPRHLITKNLPVNGRVDDGDARVLLRRAARRSNPRPVLLEAWPEDPRLLERVLDGRLRRTRG
jgi:hypothetical protein